METRVTGPRVLVAGLSGGGGKTLVSVGLAAAWRSEGLTVAAFKKGPDYIDAAWLGRAAGRPCRNLDLFLMDRRAVLGSVVRATAGADIALVEGNRGLYDGVDDEGTFSSAELAKTLAAPVLLVVDATKATRTVAALVLGCQRLDPDVALAGVVLNRMAGARHERVVRDAVERTCGVPVLGAVPRLAVPPVSERHLGLVPPEEHDGVDAAVAAAGRTVAEHVDVAEILELASRAGPSAPVGMSDEAGELREAEGAGRDEAGRAGARREPVTIGVFRDAAFQFYYPENLEALEDAGARLVYASPLEDEALPPVDALYAGGGFPETLARGLAANRPFRESVRRAVEEGLPVYAECGGAVYLGEKLLTGGGTWAMSGAVPAVFGFGERPDGHGYTHLVTVKPNPFFPPGTELRGHEFHYTYLASVIAEHAHFAFRVERGHGFGGNRDGLCYRNVLASYTHVHALGTRGWAPALVAAARERRAGPGRVPVPVEVDQ